MPGGTPFLPLLPLEAMLHAGSGVHTRPTGQAETVALPPLTVGRQMLERMVVHEEPQDATWRADSYVSVNPFVATFADAILHTVAGIVQARGVVVAETLWQTDAGAGYRRRGDRVALLPAKSLRCLPGPAISLLGGNHGNVFHWVMDCLGRLAAADAATLDDCTTLLVPAATAPFHAASLALLGATQRWSVETVLPGEAVQVRALRLPWTMTGHHRPHPALHGFFAPLTRAALACDPAWPGGRWPTLLYVERSLSGHRRLTNEAAVIAGLASRGFVPVQLERLPLATQIALFAGAEAIVAPHGAGLVHLLHAPRGCRVLELHMDAWVSWCFRRLAAIGGLAYDCVIGRTSADPQPNWVHARSWSVSVDHVVGAVDALLRR